MRPVGDVIDKMKEIKGFKNDIDLARYLKLEQSTVATWRSRKKNIPYDVLFHFCYEHDVDPIWLAGGKISDKYAEIDGRKVFSTIATPEAREQLQTVRELIRERDEFRKEVAECRARENLEGKSEVATDVERRGFAPIRVYGTEVEDDEVEDYTFGTPVEQRVAIELVSVGGSRIWDDRMTYPRGLAIYRLGGDFMEPTLNRGDFVLVDERRAIPRDGGVYVLKFEKRATCRRVQVMNDRTILVKSDNSLYEPISIDPRKDTNVTFVGRVIWVGRKIG
jgi:phage repressor protein C with HTH and peptisase S24 domain